MTVLRDYIDATLKWKLDDADSLIANHIPEFNDWTKRTDAEIAAAVTPTNYAFPPGDIRRYGGVGDGTTNNDGALQALCDVCAEGVDGYIPVGVFAYSTSPNWGFDGLTLRGERQAELKFTGTGRAFVLDNGAVGGPYIDGVTIDTLRIRGNANCTDAVYLRGVVRSTLKAIDVRTGCTDAAFRIEGGVSLHLDTCVFSGNVEDITVEPVAALYLAENSTGSGFFTADCTFTNFIAEGFAGKGVVLDEHSSGNLFNGGTWEGVEIGLDIVDDGCRRNTVTNVWFEANDQADIRVKGVNNVFIDCYSIGNPDFNSVIISSGTGTLFLGGYYKVVELQASSSDTIFIGTTFRDDPTLGIIGGDYKCIGCTEASSSIVITGKLHDVFGSIGTFTPAIKGGTVNGTQTYAANGQVGIYTRNSNTVTFSIYLQLTANSGGTGSAVITGLPFAARNVTNAFQVFPVGEFSGVTLTGAGRQLSMQINAAATQGVLVDSDSGVGITTIPIGSIGATAVIIVTGTYQI